MAVASILCYGPRRLVATQPQYSLQPQRADTTPHQPYLQRRAGLVENRTRRHGALKTARPANEPCSVGSIWIIPATAARTNKALRPAQSFEVLQARTSLRTGSTSGDSPDRQLAYAGLRSCRHHGSGGAKWIALVNIQYRELHGKALTYLPHMTGSPSLNKPPDLCFAEVGAQAQGIEKLEQPSSTERGEASTRKPPAHSPEPPESSLAVQDCCDPRHMDQPGGRRPQCVNQWHRPDVHGQRP